MVYPRPSFAAFNAPEVIWRQTQIGVLPSSRPASVALRKILFSTGVLDLTNGVRGIDVFPSAASCRMVVGGNEKTTPLLGVVCMGVRGLGARG